MRAFFGVSEHAYSLEIGGRGDGAVEKRVAGVAHPAQEALREAGSDFGVCVRVREVIRLPGVGFEVVEFDGPFVSRELVQDTVRGGADDDV